MERPVRSKGNKILTFLPKSTSFSIPKQPYSPTARDKAHAHKGFSGPIKSIIPTEARRFTPASGKFEAQEPTSPKVSCIGQIKHKKNKARKETKPPSVFGKMFGRKVIRSGRRSDAGWAGAEKPPVATGAPPLGNLRRFASGRDTLANFDWKSQRVADEPVDHRSGYMDDEDSDEVMIPHSAPIRVGGARGGMAMEPPKEVNLWKRRTMAPPMPLHLE